MAPTAADATRSGGLARSVGDRNSRKPELGGYCVRVTPESVLGGAAGVAIDARAGRRARAIAANVALLVAAALIAWGGVRRVLDS